MTSRAPEIASAVTCAFAIAAFFALVAFNVGRAHPTTSLRSACDLTQEDREQLKAAWYQVEQEK